MIKNVVKSNGELQPFSAEKLNRWGEWAAKNDLSWSDIVMRTLDQLFEGCTTKDIHQAMINVCVDKKDEKHLSFAARLLRGSIYKDVYNGAPVSFEESYTKLVKDGYWQDFNLSKEDMTKIEEVFDPQIDKNYEYTSLLQFVDKYAMREFTQDGFRLVETPQLMMMGISLALFQEDSLEHGLNFYRIIRERKLNIATPIMAAARSGANEFASCFLASAGDTLESIAASNQLCYTMTANRAGVGMEYNVRSFGDVVGNNKCKHGGKLPQYNMLINTIKSVTQGTRSGAATVTYNVLDPEIDDLLRLKNPVTPVAKRIELMDYSLAWNNEFIRRVAKNEDWLLISKKECPELHEAFYEDRDNFPSLMADMIDKYSGKNSVKSLLNPEYKPEAIKKFNGKVVKARDIMKTFITQRQETGRIYCINIDTTNDHSSFKQDTIRQSNLCVVPETKILTKSGYIPIAEVVGESLDIWNGEEWSEVDVVKTGDNQKILKVKTSSGYELECTPYHKFYVFDGYSRPYKVKRTHELVSGDKLAKFNLPVIEGDKFLDKAYLNGFYSGDGCHYKGKNIVYLYGEKRKFSERFKKYKHSYYICQEDQDREVFHMLDLKEKFFVPSEKYSIESRLSWLSGYLDADGCIYRNGKNEAITCVSVDYEFLKEMQMMLQTLGVSAKITPAMEEGYRLMPANDGTGELKDFYCKESWRLLISSYDSYKLLDLGLTFNRLKIEKRRPQRDAKHFVKITEVVDEGRIDDTYCFTEKKRGMGMFNGILTGQCQEVTLPTKGFDSVLSLYNNAKPDEDGMVGLCFLLATDVGKCSYEELDDVNYYACRALDNIISLTKYPFKALEDIGKKYRSIGVGVTNLAYFMAKNGVKYSSEEGRNLAHSLMEKQQYSLIRSSIELAKERGKFEWYDRTKYAEGLLSIDTYTKEVDKYHSQDLKLDWEALKRKQLRHGMRFVTVSAHMPCESSSGWGFSTNGLYPIRQGTVMKSRPEGLVPFTAPDYNTFKGSYEYAWDVPVQDLYKIYGIVQKFTCMAISADSYLDFSKQDGKVSVSQMMKDMIFSQKIGMKTHYYLNSRTENKHTVQEEDDGCSSCKL